MKGKLVGSKVGLDGIAVGELLGPVGWTVGCSVGRYVNSKFGAFEISNEVVGCSVGLRVGSL